MIYFKISIGLSYPFTLMTFAAAAAAAAAKSLSCVQLFATPWTAAYQAPPSMGFSRQEYWSGVPLPPPVLFTNSLQIQGLSHSSSLGFSEQDYL